MRIPRPFRRSSIRLDASRSSGLGAAQRKARNLPLRSPSFLSPSKPAARFFATIMPSLILTVLLVHIAIYLINTIGATTIDALVCFHLSVLSSVYHILRRPATPWCSICEFKFKILSSLFPVIVMLIFCFLNTSYGFFTSNSRLRSPRTPGSKTV